MFSQLCRRVCKPSTLNGCISLPRAVASGSGAGANCALCQGTGALHARVSLDKSWNWLQLALKHCSIPWIRPSWHPMSLSTRMCTAIQDIDSWLLPSQRPAHYAYVCEPDLRLDRFIDLDVDKIVHNCRGRGMKHITREMVSDWLADYEQYKVSRREFDNGQSVISVPEQRARLDREQLKSLTERIAHSKQEMVRLTPSVRSLLCLPNETLPEIDTSAGTLPERGAHQSSSAAESHVSSLCAQKLAKVDQSSRHVFLLGDAELSHIRLQRATRRILQAAGFAMFQMPYLVRPAVAEACGHSKDWIERWHISDRAPPNADRLKQLVLVPLPNPGKCPAECHKFMVWEWPLVGNSLPAYMGALCRKFFSTKQQFPVLLMHVGTSYRDSPDDSPPSLYTCAQYRSASMLSLCDSGVDTDLCYGQMHTLVSDIISRFSPAKLDVRAREVGADALRCIEAAAVAIEYVTPSGAAVQIGRVSYMGTYLSHRLRVYIGPDNEPPAHENVAPLCVNFGEIDITALLGAIVDDALTSGRDVCQVVSELTI